MNSAFPFKFDYVQGGFECQFGMTKRELMATIICAGMCVNIELSEEKLAELAVKQADTLIEELRK